MWAGQLRWGRLSHARVLGVLKNPCYTGAYMHGRYTSTRRVDPDGSVHAGITERPRAQWAVLIRDHHEGYIGWSEYLATKRNWPATAPTPAPAPRAKESRCARASSLTGRVANRCAPTTTAISAPPTNAPAARTSHHPDLPFGRRGHRR
ncbi:MAG TPA: recombinase family protein [Mycobacterium sp.]|nr:recombinase family protein [Mycobacterium sp.]